VRLCNLILLCYLRASVRIDTFVLFRYESRTAANNFPLVTINLKRMIMKKISLLILLVAIATSTYSQNYWNSSYKIVSTLTLSDAKITLEKKIDLTDYRINPDKTKFYKTTFGFGIEKNGEKRMSVIETDVYTTANYDIGMLPCMLFDYDKNVISIFTNSKASDKMYGMDGFTYTINMTTKTWTRETVFTGANWGWFSFFGGSDNGKPELWHFSFAGYYAYKSYKNSSGTWTNVNSGSIKPENASNQYYSHDNILWASTSGIDKMVLSSTNYYTNYNSSSYNNAGSEVTWTDIVAAGAILYNIWEVGDAILNDNSTTTVSDMLTKLVSCAAQNKVSSISDNPFIAATISESVESVLESKNISITDIASSTLENYVIADLNARGYSQYSVKNFCNLLKNNQLG